MGWFYIKNSGDFKTQNLSLMPENFILVTVDVVGLYPSIPHETGLKSPSEVLDKREQNTIATSELIMMADFVLKNNYFKFNGQLKQQISGTAIGTTFAKPYGCLSWIKLKPFFLKPKSYKVWCGLDILTNFLLS